MTGLIKWLLVLLTLVLLTGLSLGTGVVSMDWSSLLNASSTDPQAIIFWEIRFPKTATAILAGFSLALSGLIMQTLFRNPLAGPYELGVSSGATLGVAIWILVMQKTSFSGLVFSALAGGVCTLILVLLFSTRVQGASLLIVGLMLGYMAGGLVGVLVYFSQDNAMRSFLIWSFGTFSATGTQHLIWIFSVVLLCLLPLPLLAKPMNLILLGEEMAQSMGVRVLRIKAVMIILSSSLAAVCTAFCGPIAFLGLAVPHAARALFCTEDHRFLIPACALLGACMALAADVFSQFPQSGQILPLNSIMAIIGGPTVIYLLLKGNHEASA